MSKVWLRCTAAPASASSRCKERVVTIITAADIPIAFFARDVIEDDHSAHVRARFCGRRDGYVLVSVQFGNDVASTNFILVRDSDVVFDDAYDGTAGRVAIPSHSEARDNYRAARLRYSLLRSHTAGGDQKLLDEMWIAIESAVDPFVRWEVIAEEELEPRGC